MIVKVSPYDSYIWKRLCIIRHITEPHIFWNLGNGTLSFWHDRWIDDGPLSNFRQGALDQSKVKDFWLQDDWDREKLMLYLDVGIVDQICAVNAGSSSCPRPIWMSSPDGAFTLKSAWNLVRNRGIRSEAFKRWWSPMLTPTMSIFGLRLLRGWIPTIDVLRNKGMDITPRCFCCDATETFNHLFIQGPVANHVWNHFGNLFGVVHIPHQNLRYVLGRWWARRAKDHIMIIIPILITWFLWCGRNDAFHKNIPFTHLRTIQRILHHLNTLNLAGMFKPNTWKGVLHVAHTLNLQPPHPPPAVFLTVIWTNPQFGEIKVNVDGASKGNPGISAAGGIFRDHHGKPILGFSEFLGFHTVTFAEMYAIWRALDIAVSRGYSRLWVESDSKTVLHLLKPSKIGHWTLQYLIQRINHLRHLIDVRFTHIYREANAAADFLANDGCHHRNVRFIHANQFSGKLLGIIRLDRMHLPYVRRK